MQEREHVHRRTYEGQRGYEAPGSRPRSSTLLYPPPGDPPPLQYITVLTPGRPGRERVRKVRAPGGHVTPETAGPPLPSPGNRPSRNPGARSQNWQSPVPKLCRRPRRLSLPGPSPISQPRAVVFCRTSRPGAAAPPGAAPRLGTRHSSPTALLPPRHRAGAGVASRK